MVEPVKSEDIPDDLRRKIEEQAKAMFPGMNVVFAGDVPNSQLPPELLEAIQKIERAAEKSLLEGSCIDCGVLMPGYPEGDELPDGWKHAHGWHYFLHGADFGGWQCPACGKRADSESQHGVSFVQVDKKSPHEEQKPPES